MKFVTITSKISEIKDRNDRNLGNKGENICQKMMTMLMRKERKKRVGFMKY
jgi:hypothetical protein